MKLHASAALSLNRSRLLVRRIEEEGWTLGEAARAADHRDDERPQADRDQRERVQAARNTDSR
jgi:hypothetical protein